MASEAERCRALLEVVAGAGALSMEEWLAARADGRTVKQAYADGSAAAARLDALLTGQADAPERTDRGRRPVGVLLRELHECLTRAAARLEARGDQPLPEAVGAEIDAVEADLSPDPSPTRGGMP